MRTKDPQATSKNLIGGMIVHEVCRTTGGAFCAGQPLHIGDGRTDYAITEPICAGPGSIAGADCSAAIGFGKRQKQQGPEYSASRRSAYTEAGTRNRGGAYSSETQRRGRNSSPLQTAAQAH